MGEWASGRVRVWAGGEASAQGEPQYNRVSTVRYTTLQSTTAQQTAVPDDVGGCFIPCQARVHVVGCDRPVGVDGGIRQPKTTNHPPARGEIGRITEQSDFFSSSWPASSASLGTSGCLGAWLKVHSSKMAPRKQIALISGRLGANCSPGQ